MSVQTRKNAGSNVGAVLFEQPNWLWTWSGNCFGYRDGDKLFALDGLQVGRFVGREVYGADGGYIGEAGPGEDSMALTTNLYKKSQKQQGFVPMLADPKLPRPAQTARDFYAGYEDFPKAATLLSHMSRSLPPEIQRALRARRHAGVSKAASH